MEPRTVPIPTDWQCPRCGGKYVTSDSYPHSDKFIDAWNNEWPKWHCHICNFRFHINVWRAGMMLRRHARKLMKPKFQGNS